MQIKVYKTYDINDMDIDAGKIAAEIKQLLMPCYGNSTFWYGNIVRIKGNLAGLWERAVTDVEIKIDVQDEQMLIAAEGKCSLGASAWCWFVAGFFWAILFIWFGLYLSQYFLSRGLPEKYIRDVLESMEFKLKENPEKYIFIPGTGKQSSNIKQGETPSKEE